MEEPRIILATGATREYLPKSAPYLSSIAEHGDGFDARYLVSVGCALEERTVPDGITPVGLPQTMTKEALRGNVQYGAFLPVLPGTPNDVIVYTDGDMRMQRPLSDGEQAILEYWPRDTIGMARNFGAGDNLQIEAKRLKLRTDAEYLRNQWPHSNGRVWNAGVIIARRATYQRLAATYTSLFPSFKALLPPGQGRGVQWLICYSIAKLGLHVWELPYTWHAHGLSGQLPMGVSENGDGSIYVEDGTKVLFRHAWKV
jgi:hypothetical protein